MIGNDRNQEDFYYKQHQGHEEGERETRGHGDCCEPFPLVPKSPCLPAFPFVLFVSSWFYFLAVYNFVVNSPKFIGVLSGEGENRTMKEILNLCFLTFAMNG